MEITQQVRHSAGGIVVGPEGKIALVCQNGNSWSFPKGGIEENETPLQTALREIHEEAGIRDLELKGELGTYERYSIGPNGIGETPQWGMRKRTLFLFHTQQTQLHPNDGEVSEAQWYSLDDAFAILTHPKDKEFLESVREKIL